jgi:hypothetical protein
MSLENSLYDAWKMWPVVGRKCWTSVSTFLYNFSRADDNLVKLDIQPTILLVSPRIDLEVEKNNPLQATRHASVLDSGMLTLLYDMSLLKIAI